MGERHVAVFAFPYGGHAASLLSVVRRLARAVPSARFSFLNTAKSNDSIFSGYEDEKKMMIKAYNVADGVPEGHVLSGNLPEVVELFLKATPGNFREVVEVAERESGMRISCLLTDAFLWPAAVIAEERCVPWVSIWTSGHVSLAVQVHADVIRNKVLLQGMNDQDQDQDHQMVDFNSIPGLSSIRVGDLPEEMVSSLNNKSESDSEFEHMLQNLGVNMSRRAAVVAINSFEEIIDPAMMKDLESKFKMFLNIGPISILSSSSSSSSSSLLPVPDDPNCCLQWLDKQKAASVVYISFGTMITPPPHELVALAEALEVTALPFLWSLKDTAKDHLPQGFLQRTSLQGKAVPWAPQLQVLGHGSVGVFVSHCGWNSVLESMASGVPMICRPFFGDQKLNLRAVEDEWRIGVGVKGGVFTKTGLATDLELVLGHGSQGKVVKEELRRNLRVLKLLAAKAVDSNGSSTKNFTTLSHVVASASCPPSITS